MEGFENFIGFNPWTALLIFCNFILTFLILKKFLYKPVQKMIDDRQKEIDDLYAEGEAKRQEAEELHAQYTEQLAEAKSETQQLLREANSSAQAQREEILREAKQEAVAIREKAAADIELEKKKARNDVKDEISAIAVEIAGKIVGKELNASDQEELVEAFLRDMGDPS